MIPNDLHHIGMTQMIRRGDADILYDGPDGVLMRSKSCGTLQGERS